MDAEAGAHRYFLQSHVCSQFSESNSSQRCFESDNEIAVATDAFDGTFLTSLLLLYEHALSLFYFPDCDRPDVIGHCLGAEPAEHDSTPALSNHK
jgi:hypothetical protein